MKNQIMMAAFNPGPNGTESIAFPRALAENTRWPFEYTQREKMNLNILFCVFLSHLLGVHLSY